MDKIFLEIPTLKRQQEALDYLYENVEYNSELNGTCNLDMCLFGATYDDWLLELKKKENIEYLKQINCCQSKTFFAVRENDNRIVGMINVRYNISKDKLKTWPHILAMVLKQLKDKKDLLKSPFI